MGDILEKIDIPGKIWEWDKHGQEDKLQKVQDRQAHQGLQLEACHQKEDRAGRREIVKWVREIDIQWIRQAQEGIWENRQADRQGVRGELLLFLDILEVQVDHQAPGHHSPHDIIHQVPRDTIPQAQKVITQEEAATEEEILPIISYLPLQG